MVSTPNGHTTAPATTARQQISTMQRLKQGAAAWLLGIQPRTLRDRGEWPRNQDGTYDGRALVEARLAELTDDEDAMMSAGGNSPALEEYRRAKAALTRLDLDQRRRDLVSRAEIEDDLERLAGVLRRAGEQIQREFGSGPAEILEDALREFARQSEEAFRGDDDDDGTEAATAN